MINERNTILLTGSILRVMRYNIMYYGVQATLSFLVHAIVKRVSPRQLYYYALVCDYLNIIVEFCRKIPLMNERLRRIVFRRIVSSEGNIEGRPI